MRSGDSSCLCGALTAIERRKKGEEDYARTRKRHSCHYDRPSFLMSFFSSPKKQRRLFLLQLLESEKGRHSLCAHTPNGQQKKAAAVMGRSLFLFWPAMACRVVLTKKWKKTYPYCRFLLLDTGSTSRKTIARL